MATGVKVEVQPQTDKQKPVRTDSGWPEDEQEKIRRHSWTTLFPHWQSCLILRGLAVLWVTADGQQCRVIMEVQQQVLVVKLCCFITIPSVKTPLLFSWSQIYSRTFKKGRRHERATVAVPGDPCDLQWEIPNPAKRYDCNNCIITTL